MIKYTYIHKCKDDANNKKSYCREIKICNRVNKMNIYIKIFSFGRLFSVKDQMVNIRGFEGNMLFHHPSTLPWRTKTAIDGGNRHSVAMF